jgi:hypothetical protein
MFLKTTRICSLVSLTCLSWVAVATAAPISYGTFSGSLVGPGAVDFVAVTEDNPLPIPTPLFDPPIRVNNKLLFFPTSFATYVANGGYDMTSGTLAMSIKAPAGYFLESIIVDEVGDCTLLGAGTANTWADIYGFLGVTDLVPGTHGSHSDVFDTTPPPPFLLPKITFVEFNGHAQIDLTGMGISQIDLDFGNTLEASSEPGTTAFIQKKTFTLEATTMLIPEPASVLLLAGCLFPLLTLGRTTRRP